MASVRVAVTRPALGMPASHVVVVGLNHRSAPIELRERFAFRQEQMPEVFERLRDEVGLEEAAVLSTCNRVEIYGAVAELDGHLERMQAFLSAHGDVPLEMLAPSLYAYREPDSVQHLFRVASGVDSMVLGETEILQQVKATYETARAAGATGKVFNVLFQRALNTAKAVRTDTAISRGSTSVGAVAVELAGKIFGNLAHRAVLLIGAGKIGEMTLKRLRMRGVRRVRIMNRSPERAVTLAAMYGAAPVLMEDLAAELIEADILISSTSAEGYLLRRADVMTALHARRQRPLYVIDLGVPRNIEPSAGELENVYCFDIDDLAGLVDRSQTERRQAVQDSDAIIARKVEQFLTWWQEEMRRCDPSSSVLAEAP